MIEHLYDTHYHLDLQKDRSAAVRAIEENRIYTIAVTNLPDLYLKESMEIVSKYIRIAPGFHPELVHLYKQQIPLMWNLLPEVRYIGEVGLDFSDRTYEKEQLAFFYELVERCRYDSNKVFTIHSRRAVGQVLNAIGDNFRFKAILHWFTGNRNELERAVELGCYFSINEAMLKSKKFLEMLPIIPSSRILIETDSPFIPQKGSHAEMLCSIQSSLRKSNPNIDVWLNFRRLLGE